MGSETRGIELRGSVLMEEEVEGVDESTLGSVTGDVIEILSLHWLNRLRRSVIASILELHVTVGASDISHVRMEMEWMMWSSGAREGFER